MSKLGNDIVASGGPSITTYDEKGHVSVHPVSASPGSNVDGESTTDDEASKQTQTRQLSIEAHIPRFPEGSSIVYHSVVRIATLEDVLKAIRVPDAPLSNLNLKFNLFSSSLKSRLSAALAPAEKDVRPRASTDLSRGSGSLNIPESAPHSAVDWVAVKAVVTSDKILHLFQFRIDAEEWVAQHRERGVDAVTIGHGLVLLKSICINVSCSL